MEGNKYPYIATYKLVLVGDGGVGKSTLIKRLRTGDFEETYERMSRIKSHQRMFDHNRAFLYEPRPYTIRGVGHGRPREDRQAA